MSKLFKSHVPKPAGAAQRPARAPREQRNQAASGKDGAKTAGKAEEIGGPEGPEPTRYGDWEIKGRCIDF